MLINLLTMKIKIMNFETINTYLKIGAASSTAGITAGLGAGAGAKASSYAYSKLLVNGTSYLSNKISYYFPITFNEENSQISLKDKAKIKNEYQNSLNGPSSFILASFSSTALISLAYKIHNTLAANTIYGLLTGSFAAGTAIGIFAQNWALSEAASNYDYGSEQEKNLSNKYINIENAINLGAVVGFVAATYLSPTFITPYLGWITASLSITQYLLSKRSSIGESKLLPAIALTQVPLLVATYLMLTRDI